MIEVINVEKTYNHDRNFAVRELNFSIATGEILVLLGSSGCGKTTTLKLLNRLIEPSFGTIKIDGIDIATQNPVSLRRAIGYVFQQIGLFPHLTVAENITIVLRLLGETINTRQKRANELLELVNLDPVTFADRNITELSGGQQQRVGVARALANQPKYMLMDEPFGALDSITRASLQTELLRLNQELHKTIVFVTHDILEAFRLADRIAVMNQGRIIQIGTKTDILRYPATDFVKDLVTIPLQQVQDMKDVITNN